MPKILKNLRDEMIKNSKKQFIVKTPKIVEVGGVINIEIDIFNSLQILFLSNHIFLILIWVPF